MLSGESESRDLRERERGPEGGKVVEWIEGSEGECARSGGVGGRGVWERGV